MTAKRPLTAARGRSRPSAPGTSSNRHDFRKGDLVSVFRLRRNGSPVIEGRARIIAPVPDIPHFYFICFIGERGERLRFVHPALQGEPRRVLAALIDLWRGELDPALLEDSALRSRPVRLRRTITSRTEP